MKGFVIATRRVASFGDYHRPGFL